MKIQIDHDTYEAKNFRMTGQQILVLAQKFPQEYALNGKRPGGHRDRIQPDQQVIVSQYERFETIRLQTLQG